MEVEQPQSQERRREVATGCRAGLELELPVLVDDMGDTVAKAYNAMPDRLFILDAGGRVAYRGDRGPRGFKVDEMEAALARFLGEG